MTPKRGFVVNEGDVYVYRKVSFSLRKEEGVAMILIVKSDASEYLCTALCKGQFIRVSYMHIFNMCVNVSDLDENEDSQYFLTKMHK